MSLRLPLVTPYIYLALIWTDLRLNQLETPKVLDFDLLYYASLKSKLVLQTSTLASCSTITHDIFSPIETNCIREQVLLGAGIERRLPSAQGTA